ncbi:hypothetical protein O3M35_002869 [Rhynocoris fuscipes]|uniref:Cytochrome P450 n=1 Tax=Rhynocoris fuscipes TaxID=488301 RepID=A0AAW1CQY2_9HEMI
MWQLLSDSVVLTFTLITAIVSLIYYYGTKTYDYWKKKGIPYIRPKYPYLGNTYESAFSFKTILELQQQFYNYFKGNRYGGLFNFQRPMLFIRDPDLVESVLIKDFTSFYNRNVTGDIKKEPLQAHLLNLEDQQWKSLRAKLSPTFTSGKLKGMHPQLVECADSLVKYISDFADKSEPIEVREVMAKFTTDVIGSCAFGLNTNALNDPESEFRKMGRRIFKPTFLSRLRASLRTSRLLLKVARLFSRASEISGFFTKVLKDTMTYRESNNVSRNDFVQILMELKKNDMEKQKTGQLGDDHLIIDDNVIASNAFVFFIAGFETTASTLSYCLYELSIHEDIQEEAYKHVVSVLKKHGGEVSYEAVKEMTFLQNIFAETLRLHPPAMEIRRVATKNYVVPGTKLLLPKDSLVLIPIYSLHHDPEYYPDPEQFKPERFDNDRANIRKGTYLPFGDGPRICIGKRFAEMEMQVALVKLLLKYKFKLNSKTISPLVYNPAAFLLVPIGGVWVDLERRQ